MFVPLNLEAREPCTSKLSKAQKFKMCFLYQRHSFKSVVMADNDGLKFSLFGSDGLQSIRQRIDEYVYPDCIISTANKCYTR